MTTRRPVSAFASLKKGRNDNIHAHVSRINTHCKWIYPSPTNANLGRLKLVTGHIGAPKIAHLTCGSRRPFLMG